MVCITDRFNEMCAFYGVMLGRPVTRQWDDTEDDGGRGRIFGFGDGRIEVMEGPADSVDPVSGVFLSIEVDDVDALHERLVAAGVRVVEPLADQPWGHRNLAVLDPSGLKLVFFHWRPGARHDG